MAIRREDLFELINKLPDSKLDELAQVVKEMSTESEDDKFNKGVDYLFENYNDTLDRLKDL